MKAFWRKPAAEPPVSPPLPENVDPQVFKTVAQAPVFNPSDDEHLKFAHYRADAIARELEQRAAERREPHPEQERMVGEAMELGWRLVRAGRWTSRDCHALHARLIAAKQRRPFDNGSGA
jgi:hypothetical protein